MVRFALSPYKIRFRKYRKKEYLRVDNLGTDEDDYSSDLLKEYLEGLKQKPFIGVDKKHTLSVDDYYESGHLITGIIKKGEFGMELDLLDTVTGQVNIGARQEKHSEPIPYFFAFEIPPEKKYGFAILQLFKGMGVKTYLENHMKRFFKSKGYTISLNPIYSGDLFEKLQGARVVKFRARRTKVPLDVADRIHEGSRDDLEEELVIAVKSGKQIILSENILDKLRKLMTTEETRSIEILEERYDEIKINVEENKERRTLTFGPDNRMRESMPLNRIPDMEGGFPTYDFLLEKAEAYLIQLHEEYAM